MIGINSGRSGVDYYLRIYDIPSKFANLGFKDL